MKSKNPFLYFMLISLLYSCSNLFVQKSIFVPLFRDKGEAKVESSFGREGININTAYAVSNHFSMMANGFSTFDNSSVYKNRYNYQTELGLGFFKTFQDSFIYETFIGASRGWLNSTYNRTAGELSNYYELGIFNPYANSLVLLKTPNGQNYSVNGYGNYYTVFMQHSFGMHRTFTNWNSFAWTMRAEYVKFDKYTEVISINNQPFLYSVSAPDKTFFQLLLVDKIGITQELMLTMQLGANFDVTETTDVFEWNKIFCYVGVEYSLQTIQNKKRIHKTIFKRRYKNLYQRGY